jgi:hypothetical protein
MTIPITVPTRVKNWMMNPDNTGSFGKYVSEISVAATPEAARIPNAMGRLIGSKLLFVEDMRGSTLTVGGSEGAYTLKPGFCKPGNNDDRNKSDWSNTSGSTNYVYDICHALNEGALAEFIVDAMNTKLSETDQFDQIEEKGLYLGEGIQMPVFDKDSGSRTGGAFGSRTAEYTGSAMIPIGRMPWQG